MSTTYLLFVFQQGPDVSGLRFLFGIGAAAGRRII